MYAMPKFDPSAIKSTLKKAVPHKKHDEEHKEDKEEDKEHEQTEGKAEKHKHMFGMPKFDPSAIKSTLKKAVHHKEKAPEEEKHEEEGQEGSLKTNFQWIYLFTNILKPETSPRKPKQNMVIPGLGNIGSIKLKKSPAKQPAPGSAEPASSATAEPAQVDFRNVLKAKK